MKVKSIKIDFTISDANNSKLKKKHFFHCIISLCHLLIFIAPCRFPLFICQVANILVEKNLPKCVRPRGNWTYNDLRLSTHPRPTTNATRLLSQLRFEILELVLKYSFSRTFLKEEKKYHLTIPTFELWWELFRTLRL